MKRHAKKVDRSVDFTSIGTAPSVRDIADYVEELSRQLAHIAAESRLTLLAALLQLAAAEARRTSESQEVAMPDTRASKYEIPTALFTKQM